MEASTKDIQSLAQGIFDCIDLNRVIDDQAPLENAKKMMFELIEAGFSPSDFQDFFALLYEFKQKQGTAEQANLIISLVRLFIDLKSQMVGELLSTLIQYFQSTEYPSYELSKFSEAVRHLVENKKISDDYLLRFFKTLRHFGTLDFSAFSLRQLESKTHLIDALVKTNFLQAHRQDWGTYIVVLGGWYGVLAELMLNELEIGRIYSIDIDTHANLVAEKLNSRWVSEGWKFKTSSQNLMDLNYSMPKIIVSKNDGSPKTLEMQVDLIINTVCEHVENYDKWWDMIPKGCRVALQSNNYFGLKEHVNCHATLEDFKKASPMTDLVYESELDLGPYSRFTLIGEK